MNIKEIKYFRTDGKNCPPNGVYLFNGSVYADIQQNRNKFIRQKKLTESFIPEGVTDISSQYGLAKYRGGMIVFSTDVNAIVTNMNISNFKKFIYKKFYTLMNTKFKDAQLNNLVTTWNEEFGEIPDFFIGAFTIGKFFKGRYVSDGQIFDEKSTTIEFGGMPSEMLLLFGMLLAEAFKQETVLVKDFNNNKIFYVDNREIEGTTKETKPSEKIELATNELKKLKHLNTEAD